MSDDFSELDRLLVSPELLAAWRTSMQIESVYAWHLLNHSGQIQPAIPFDYIPHHPRLRFWDDASGWTDAEPTTLTVFRGSSESTLCRKAVWHCRQPGAARRRLIEFMNGSGEGKFIEPAISIMDAIVPVGPLREHLQKISTCRISAICLQRPFAESVTCDVGSQGFEYFSQDQPPTVIKYQWSEVVPQGWQTLLQNLRRLHEFLVNCFNGPT